VDHQRRIGNKFQKLLATMSNSGLSAGIRWKDRARRMLQPAFALGLRCDEMSAPSACGEISTQPISTAGRPQRSRPLFRIENDFAIKYNRKKMTISDVAAAF